MTVKITSKVEETRDVAVFELTGLGGEELPPFSAGAHIDVEVGPGVTRQYSLCNDPTETQRYVIGVLKDADSRGGSVAMHGLNVGDSIRISGPRNHFPLAPSAPDSLLLAGGIGITPILCMAERLAQIDAPFHMHYCARSRAHMAFYHRITRSGFHDKVQLHFDDGDASQKLDIDAAIAELAPGGHVYVCGPGGFIEFVLEAAKRAGLLDARVHREFFAAVPSSLVGSADAFQVQIASTGQIIDVAANEPVTIALEKAGLEILTSCEAGVCGTCLTRVLEGTPDHRDFYLTPAEKETNQEFLPCCSRSKTPLLVLDL